jgi:hypothetical protein
LVLPNALVVPCLCIKSVLAPPFLPTIEFSLQISNTLSLTSQTPFIHLFPFTPTTATTTTAKMPRRFNLTPIEHDLPDDWEHVSPTFAVNRHTGVRMHIDKVRALYGLGRLIPGERLSDPPRRVPVYPQGYTGVAWAHGQGHVAAEPGYSHPQQYAMGDFNMGMGMMPTFPHPQQPTVGAFNDTGMGMSQPMPNFLHPQQPAMGAFNDASMGMLQPMPNFHHPQQSAMGASNMDMGMGMMPMPTFPHPQQTAAVPIHDEHTELLQPVAAYNVSQQNAADTSSSSSSAFLPSFSVAADVGMVQPMEMVTSQQPAVNLIADFNEVNDIDFDEIWTQLMVGDEEARQEQTPPTSKDNSSPDRQDDEECDKEEEE